MLYFYKNKNKNYNIKMLNNIDEIKNILNNNRFSFEDYKYKLDIYMIDENENFYKIKKLSDICNYAIIRDYNGVKSVILNNNVLQEAKINSIFFTHDLLYNFGYYELFHLNKDIYEYKDKDNLRKFYVLNIKEQGCFLNIIDISVREFKKFIKKLQKLGIKFYLKNCEVDNVQVELNKAIFKK